MSISRWYESTGRNPEIVLSSKVIMTRNLKGYNFPQTMELSDKDEVVKKVEDALSDKGMSSYRMEGISDKDRSNLIDSQVMSGTSLFSDPEGKAILTNDSRSLSVVVNDQDHIKIRAQLPGYTNYVYKMCEDLAVDLENKLDVAFSEKYGYLGSSVVSTGLGFKLMFTIAIPGIVRTGDGLEILQSKVRAHDWKIYPFFNDDKVLKGDVYVVASSASMGHDEISVLDSAAKLMEEIMMIENLCRDNLRKNRNDLLENSFYRAYGILYYSKSVDPLEALDLISWIRLYHGYEDRNEIGIEWDQINTITSKLLWSIYPMRIKGSKGYNADSKYTAAMIARVIRNRK
ncbi:MAG: hypothetical protein IKE53_06420 [Clostridiales bacterium]|nr:hypothetical protein [Clostridiales bacterium]